MVPVAQSDSQVTGQRSRHAWRTKEMRELFDAILTLETRQEVESFFRDLCTLSELEAMAHRWEVARLLERGLPYLEIAERTGASTTTVTRVAHWLRHGEGGYRVALDRAGS
jgi:TrpR-related protein YerC/YecD